MDRPLGFHLAQIIDDRLPPLRAIAGMTRTALAELIRNFHFQPKRIARLTHIGRIEQPRRHNVQPQRPAFWRQHQVAARPMRLFPPASSTGNALPDSTS